MSGRPGSGRKKSIYTDEILFQIKELWEAKKTVKEIYQELNLPTNFKAFKKQCSRLELNPKKNKPPKKYDKKLLRQIVELLKNGIAPKVVKDSVGLQSMKLQNFYNMLVRNKIHISDYQNN